MLSAMAYITI